MTASDFVAEPARRTRVSHEADVLVVGGGSAGVAAAVAAARDGADVLLVERYGSLGGLATGGLIVLLLTLDDGRGRQTIAGLCQELTERMARRGGACFPPREQWGSADAALVEQRAPLGAGVGSRAARGALLGRVRPGGDAPRLLRDAARGGRARAVPRLGLRAAARGRRASAPSPSRASPAASPCARRRWSTRPATATSSPPPAARTRRRRCCPGSGSWSAAWRTPRRPRPRGARLPHDRRRDAC